MGLWVRNLRIRKREKEYNRKGMKEWLDCRGTTNSEWGFSSGAISGKEDLESQDRVRNGG